MMVWELKSSTYYSLPNFDFQYETILLVFKITHKHKLFQLQVNVECKIEHCNNKINIRKFSRRLRNKLHK